jgi:hydroxymethylglutaryl-CoA synthase
MAFEPEYGVFTNHVMDFWRPNYSDIAFVDGKYSAKIYLESLEACYKSYAEQTKRQFSDHARFCYHLPFVRMAQKAHERLSKILGVPHQDELVAKSFHYSRQLGNSYTASIFIGLASLLEQTDEDLANKRVGFFSYGSGCVAEFFSGIVLPGYKAHLHKAFHESMLEGREQIDLGRYEQFFNFQLPQDGSEFATPLHKTQNFRLAGIKNHERLYSKV